MHCGLWVSTNCTEDRPFLLGEWDEAKDCECVLRSFLHGTIILLNAGCDIWLTLHLPQVSRDPNNGL